MQITVLGELEVELDGRSIVPSAAKPRQLLALLAMRRNHVVPVGVLMEELWGAAPPRSAAATLQSYVLRLRREMGLALRPGGTRTAKEVLVTCHGGYLLRVPNATLDVAVYEDLAARGGFAYDANDFDRAAELLGRALELWRGPAFMDLSVGSVLEVEAVRLAESRLAVLMTRIDAELHRGRHAALLTELAAPLAHYPMHEGLHAQAMLALYRSGRQTDALRVYGELRSRLREELGLEPCSQMQRIHQAVLEADPHLDLGLDARPGWQRDINRSPA